MTNEVEQILLENNKDKGELTYAQKTAYAAYREIWRFLIYVRNFDFETLSIRFNINNYDGMYSINRTDGISYEIHGDGLYSKWNTFYEGRDSFYINTILNTSIDYNLLFKLLGEDGFCINYLDDTHPILVYIETSKTNIEKVIKSTLLRNKVLKLEM